MNSNENPASAGAFVIAGVTFDDDGGQPLHWSSGRVAAVAPVDITVGPGVTVSVDVARPSSVLQFSIAEFSDEAALINACEDSAAVAELVERLRTGSDAGVPQVSLRPHWARKALVAGVARWLPRPLHEGALLLDEAAAHQAVGESLAAARRVALATPVLEALTEDCENGQLSAAASAQLTDVARLAEQAVANLDWGARIRDCAERIAAAAGLSDIDFDLALLRLQEAEHALVADLEWTPGPNTHQEMIDPMVVRARVIKWVDGSHRELHVRETLNGDEVSAELSVDLSDFVDDRGYEVSRVSVFVADTTSEVVLRTASTRADGRTLQARLTYRRPQSGKVVYGVFDADIGVTAVRAGREVRDLVEIDRLVVDAWNTERAALVVQAGAGGLDGDPSRQAHARAAQLLGDARRLVGTAMSKLKGLVRRLSMDDPSAAEGASRRLASVEAYGRGLAEQGLAGQPGCEPLLAELLRLEPEAGAGGQE